MFFGSFIWFLVKEALCNREGLFYYNCNMIYSTLALLIEQGTQSGAEIA